MRIAIAPLCAALLLHAAAGGAPPASAADSPSAAPTGPRHALGLAAGIPQTVALEYERTLSRRFELCVHAGSAVLLSSAGVRVRYGSTAPGLRPGLFVGGTAIHAVGQDTGEREGWGAYAWLGPTVVFRARSWKAFAEICLLAGGSEDRGLGDTLWVFPFNPALAGGLAFRF